MPDIVTVTLNPALDLSTSTERVQPTLKLRCSGLRRDPGGGGINVARVVRRLGLAVAAIYTVGGPIGELLQRFVTLEDVDSLPIPIASDTRENFTVDELPVPSSSALCLAVRNSRRSSGVTA
jgi:6-phosphofructokinase 2